MAFRRDRRLLWPLSDGSLSPPPPPPSLIHSLHAIWYLGGAWLPVGSFLSAPWHNVVFYGLLSRGFVLCFIFWVPVVVAVVVVCCLLALRAGSAPQAASLYYNILRLHFAFRISHLLFTLYQAVAPFVTLSINCCISLRGICVDSLKGMHNAKIP